MVPSSAELCTNGLADRVRKLFCAHGEVLKNLNCAQTIVPSLCLHRNDVVHTVLVYPDIHFVRFGLPDLSHRGSEMTLQGVACNSQKNVQEAIVSEARKQSLFIIEQVHHHRAGRGIRNLDPNQSGLGGNTKRCDCRKRVVTPTTSQNDPSLSPGCFSDN